MSEDFDDISLDDFEPSFIEKKVRRFVDGEWLTPHEPQVIFFQGMRGGGKSVSVNDTAEKLYNEGFLILHIWAARSFENLYWCINKNCKKKYSLLRQVLIDTFQTRTRTIPKIQYDRYLEVLEKKKMVESDSFDKLRLTRLGVVFLKKELLHCNCDKAYPILWVVPDYISFDQKSIDRFNGAYWKNFEEYHHDYVNCKTSQCITKEEFESKYPNGLKKPIELTSNSLLKVAKITTPTSAARKEKFKDQWLKIMLKAREERRVVVINPEIFAGMDKFDTASEIMRIHNNIMNSSGHFDKLKPSQAKNKIHGLTRREKSQHKVAIIVNEIRSLTPSSRLSGEKDSSKSKKAFFDFVPEARHSKTHLIADYQNPEDLFAGVRYQANIVVIKRASANILGGDYTWLFDKVEKDRAKILRSRVGIESEQFASPPLREYLDKFRPRVGKMPPNKGYITYPNNEIKLETFNLPNFHHKTSSESFMSDTGISWIVDKNKKSEIKSIEEADSKTPAKKKKEIQNEIFEQMMVDSEKGMKYVEILKKYQEREAQGIIADIGLKKLNSKTFTTKIGRWKNSKKEEKNSEKITHG